MKKARLQLSVIVVMILASMFVPNAVILKPVHSTSIVRVLTPNSHSIYDLFKAQFEATHPDVTLEFKGEGGTLCLEELRATKDSPQWDVWWGGGFELFDQAKSEDLLYQYSDIPSDLWNAIPENLYNIKLKDPDKYFFGYTLSGFGIMYNIPYLQAHNLSVPHDWTDLADPVYRGHIVMCTPMASSSTLQAVQIILQVPTASLDGWTGGWQLLIKIAANVGAFMPSSWDVPAKVSAGEYGIGICIDFMAFQAIAKGFPCGYVYPANKTIITPDSIAIVKNGPNLADAKTFVNYVLSIDGQKLNFDANIGREPVRQDAYAYAPAGYTNPFTTPTPVLSTYSADLSSKRTDLIKYLFDSVITNRHQELKNAWDAIYAAKAKLEATAASQDLWNKWNDAVSLASSVPVSYSQSTNVTFLTQFTTDATLRSQLVSQWDSGATTNYNTAYTEASALLGQAEQEKQFRDMLTYAAIAVIAIVVLAVLYFKYVRKPKPKEEK